MAKHRFVLGGKDFELSREDVELALEHVAPSDVRKYFVSVHGRRYPVKQALAIATGVPSDRFISTDATRVLQNIGFDVERVGQQPKPARTESELLFEEYLTGNALGFFEFEPKIEGTSRTPDYRLNLDGKPVLIEVKEFRPDPALFVNMRGGFYDPYRLIREKIEAARKKFKDLESFPCCLVLYNCGHPHVELSSWEIVYAAMLGNLGFQFPVNTETGAGDPDRSERVFHGGGKMFRYKNGEPIAEQNTTISAIVALGHLGLGMRRLSAHIDRVKAAGGGIGVQEISKLVEESRNTERDASLRQLRAVVHENPFARIRLPGELFCGAYDERYGAHDGKLQRIYAGKGILELEAEEARCGSHRGSPVLRALGRKRREVEGGEGASR